jgi:hypothetical protein
MRRAMFENHTLRHVSCGEDNVLRIRGFIVDTISEVIDYPQMTSPSERPFLMDLWHWTENDAMLGIALEFLGKSLALAQRVLERAQGDKERFPPEFLMAIFADCRITDAVEHSYHDAWTCLTTGGFKYFKSLEGDRKSMVWACLQIILHVQIHSFFATQGGRFGIATPGVKLGDKVCAFYGGEPLHILRHGGTNSESYTFSGVAFIAYLMEQQERDAARLRPDEIFNIR